MRAPSRRQVLALSVALAAAAAATVGWAATSRDPGAGSAAGTGSGGDGSGGDGSDVPLVTWTMVDVTPDEQQGDAHLLEGRDRVVLVDAGSEQAAEERLVPALERRGIDALDDVFVTHAHEDHYGGLAPLIESDVELGTVHFAEPDAEVCRSEEPWGCDLEEVRSVFDLLASEQVEVAEPRRGAEVRLGSGATVRVLFGFDGVDTPVGRTDINDTSLIMALDAGDVSVLFAGDLNEELGGHLADVSLPLGSVRLLKVPHHGAEKLAPDEFFESVDPDMAFVPGPSGVWCGERGERARRWFETRDIPTFVSGLDGDVAVSIGEDGAVDVDRTRDDSC